MKNIITILILLFYISWTVAPVIKVGDYIINLKEYKENCINKEKPKLKCDGKCQLIDNSLEDDTTKPTLNLFNYDFSFAFIFKMLNVKTTDNEVKLNYNFSYNNLYHFIFYLTLLKPPISN